MPFLKSAVFLIQYLIQCPRWPQSAPYPDLLIMRVPSGKQAQQINILSASRIVLSRIHVNLNFFKSPRARWILRSYSSVMFNQVII